MALHNGYSRDGRINDLIHLHPNRLSSNVSRQDGSLDQENTWSGHDGQEYRRNSGPVPPLYQSRNLVRPASDKLHVLVMDDDYEILDIFGQLLRDEAYAVTLSSNPLDVETISRLQPNVIITDAIFRHTTAGLRAINDLFADARTCHIPVICCTTLPRLVGRLSHPGFATLSKPFELDAVLEAVSGAIAQAGNADQHAPLT